MVIKNYKELCELLEIKCYNGGNGKICQMKNLKRYIRISRNKNKIIIDEIYSNSVAKVDKRLYNGNSKYKDLMLYDPEKCKFINNTYGYDIKELSTNSSKILNWLCELCDSPFDSSISSIFSNAKVACKRCRLSKGSRMIYDLLIEYGIDFEQEYYFDELRMQRPLRFDYAIFQNGRLNCLIEYDGEYHDISVQQQDYDEAKNTYCKEKGIELIRIDHKYKDACKLIIFTKLLELLPDNEEVATSFQNEYNRMFEKVNKLKTQTEYYSRIIDGSANKGNSV